MKASAAIGPTHTVCQWVYQQSCVHGNEVIIATIEAFQEVGGGYATVVIDFSL